MLDSVTEGAKLTDEESLSVRTGRESWAKENPSEYCPDNVECKKLSGSCIDCIFDKHCIYGREYNTTCKAKEGVVCVVSRSTSNQLG